MHIYLNIFRTDILSNLQQNSDRIHTCSIAYSTTSYSHFKDKVFIYSEFLNAIIKDADKFISCTPIKPNNIIHTKFAFFYFMNVPSTFFLMKNYMMEQMLN